jgi:crossover junction endodeoxyribonuclease RusA
VITELHVTIPGRPAPQGSKKQGEHGQLREQSPYLPAWRAAIKAAVYREYQNLGIAPGELPVFTGPIAIGVTFWLAGDRRVDGPPDLDKLLRGLWDALTQARVWEDDSRVVEVLWARKAPHRPFQSMGADVMVRRVE